MLAGIRGPDVFRLLATGRRILSGILEDEFGLTTSCPGGLVVPAHRRMLGSVAPGPE